MLAKDPRQFLLKCQKECGGIFRVKLVFKTFVFSDGSHRSKFFSLPEKQLSFDEAILQNGVASDATVGRDTVHNPWHVPILKRTVAAKAMNNYIGRIQKAVERALQIEGVFDLQINESKEIPDLRTFAWNIVALSSATSFLGEDVCQRHPEIISVFVDFHRACLNVIQLSNFLPESLLWISAMEVKKYRSILRKAIIPEVESRRTISPCDDEDNSDKPFDILTALIQTGKSAQVISDRFMAYIFAAMITTAGAMTNALNDLAGRPEQWKSLLDEQQVVKKRHGSGPLTSAALGDMPRLHAFIWESMFMAGLPIQQTRIVMEDGLFLGNDDMCLEKDSMVAISGILARTLVDRPKEFRPERFLNDDGSLVSDQASIGFFPFGIGRHLCPGRHFAVAEIKGAMATLLRTFQIQTISGNIPIYKALQADMTRIAEPVRFTRLSQG